MAKNVLQKHWDGTKWVELHPVTKASNVIMNDDSSVETTLSAHLNETMSRTVIVTEPIMQSTKTTVDLGFRPKYVSIQAAGRATPYVSVGATDGTSGSSVRMQDALWDVSSSIISLAQNISNSVLGSVTFTSTGLEIEWLVTGTLDEGTTRRLVISALTHGEGS